jgi:RimJ/RimL family protein N-acetyltransferase
LHLTHRPLTGTHIRIEPITDEHREELRAALDCDAENWNIQVVSAQGPEFDRYWKMLRRAQEAPAPLTRMPFAVRDLASGRLAGTSSFLFVWPLQSSLEIGSTWFRPEYRGGPVNPEAKLLMLGEAFEAGARRVQFTIDARNARSQAAVLKLGATKEGMLRQQLVTWTGHLRDSAVFSILSEEWPRVRKRLVERLARFEEGRGVTI